MFKSSKLDPGFIDTIGRAELAVEAGRVFESVDHGVVIVIPQLLCCEEAWLRFIDEASLECAVKVFVSSPWRFAPRITGGHERTQSIGNNAFDILLIIPKHFVIARIDIRVVVHDLVQSVV